MVCDEGFSKLGTFEKTENILSWSYHFFGADVSGKGRLGVQLALRMEGEHPDDALIYAMPVTVGRRLFVIRYPTYFSI